MSTLVSDKDSFTLEYPDAELVFGFVCAVGTDYRPVVEYLSNLLKRAQYKVKIHSLSDFFPDIASNLDLSLRFPASNEYERIDSRMQAGNAIREKTGEPGFLALDAASRIHSMRTGVDSEEPEALPNTAHVLVSLKRPEEVEILRRIYGSGFFLIGIFGSEGERRDYLETEKGVYGEELDDLIRRDQKEGNNKYGQRTRDTFEHADVFVALKDGQYKLGLRRFIHLVFGYPYDTPFKDEYGMFFAYSASARSGALGRQVGAAILSKEGDLLAVGCNDVPSPRGGLYWEEDGPRDHRDHKEGEDSNDRHKKKLADEALGKFREASAALCNGANDPQIDTCFLAAMSVALGDITEFGRCVHAEMDAITTCARKGIAISESILYTTTFPCHNCTRHIVASGIKRVVYIEPYPKSQAGSLHGDAICFEDEDSTKEKIPFVPFVGIGPLRFFDLFSLRLSDGYSVERKTNGKIIDWRLETNAKPRVPMAPTSYIQREELAFKNIVVQYKRKDEQREISRERSEDGLGVQGVDGADSSPSRKVAAMESRRDIQPKERTGTSDGPLFQRD